MRVRDAKPEELAPKPRRARPLSPRQQAIRKREQAIDKVLNELGAGPASAIKKIELEEGEKLPTIRAAIAKRIKSSGSNDNCGCPTLKSMKPGCGVVWVVCRRDKDSTSLSD